jgi:hypothetical protein
VRFGRNSAPISDHLFLNKPNPGTSTAGDFSVMLAVRAEAVEERYRIHGCAEPTQLFHAVISRLPEDRSLQQKDHHGHTNVSRTTH